VRSAIVVAARVAELAGGGRIAAGCHTPCADRRAAERECQARNTPVNRRSKPRRGNG
jgi:hypothetical protein